MTPRTLRLKLDYNLDPSDSEVTIEAVKSNAFNIEFGIFQDSIPYDLSGLTSVSMVIRPARGTATNLAAITLPVASLTALPNSVRWNRGTMQHGVFEWTTAQMNQTVTGDYDDYWWSCYALLTTNEEVTLGNGVFRIYESNIANGGVPPVNPGATITADEADARYVRFDAATSLTAGEQTQARENIDADNAANLTSGIIPDARMPNLTGDVTTVEGAVATTIGAGKVTNAMLAGSIDLATKVTGILPDSSMPNLTGDVTTVEGAVATTLATVNSNVGSFGSATQVSAITVNAKGLVTAASAITVTPAESSLTFTDITTNNATSLKHGFLPKLSGSSGDVLKGDGTWAAESAGAGTVTSVAMTVPSILAVSGSPITASGTLAVTLATQSANIVLAGPTSGGAATPTFRSIVDADLPTGIAVNKLAALTASRLVVSDASGFISASSVTATEAGYLSGVTSALQTQLDAKLSTATAASTYQPLDADLTAIAALASSAGVLTNNGAGVYSYTGFGSGVGQIPLLVDLPSDIGQSAIKITNATSSRNFFLSVGSGSGADIEILLPATSGVIAVPTTVGTATTILHGNASGAPTYGAVSLTADVSGTLPVANGGTGITALGTGVATALGINVGSAGAFVALNGALGTPSSGTLTSCTGLPAAGVVGTAAILGANTFTALQTITQASANAGILASTGYSLTGSGATNMVDLAGTWNTTGAPTAIKLNITNTASNAASLLMDLQASTVPKFSVRVDGLVTISSSGATKLRFTDTATSLSFYIQQQSYISKFVNETSGAAMHFVDGSTNVYLKLENAYQAAFTQTGISFTNSYSALGTEDVFLTRKAAATLQLGQDAAGVTNQSLTAASRITSDGVGANLTISGGNGRGGAGGSLIFSTYDTQGAATIGTLQTRMTIDTTGLTTFSGATMIDGSADAVQLTVQGHSTQTSNVFLIEKSDGTDLLTVSNTGVVTLTQALNTTGNLNMSSTWGVSAATGNQTMYSTATFGWASGTGGAGVAVDALFARKAAATIQLGADAAGVTHQTLTAASRITSDGVGANLTISAGNGRGGAGGSLIFSTYTTAAAATIGTLTTRLTLDTAGLLTFADAVDMAFNTTTGTKIGTATGQKIGFWNATPVVQQVLATGGGATVDNVISLLQTLGLCKQS